MHVPYSRPFRDYRPPRQSTFSVSAVARETAILAAALALYLLVRGLVRDQPLTAFANTSWLIGWEQRVGLFHEPAIQSWAFAHDWPVTLANWVYVWLYWPSLAATMLWLAIRHRREAAVYRNALLASGALGLLCFALLPLAPPRFVPHWGFIDTVAAGSDAYTALYPASVANWYAAMPSLHVGWTALMGIALILHARRRVVKLIGVLLPLAMFLATIVTANHFIADGIAGMMVAFTGLVIARRVPRVRPAAAAGRIT